MTSRSSHSNQYGSQGLGSVFKSFTRSFKTPNKQVSIAINPTVVGGAEDQIKLFRDLSQGNSTNVRVKAASQVIDSLQKYSISSIPEIWYCARDLCDLSNNSNTRIVSLNLLILCIENDDVNSVGSRLAFFKDIIKYCQVEATKIDPQFNLFIEALKKLTNDGRDVHDFCLFEQKTLGTFLSECLNSAKNDHSNDQIIVDIIKFTSNCMNYSFSLFTENEILLIFQEIIDISSRTSDTLILYSCVQLIDNVILYGSIPMKSFPNIIEILCGAFTLGPQFSKLVWEAFSNLLSKTPEITILQICNLLGNENQINGRNINACVGSISLLQRIIQVTPDTQLFDTSFGSLLKAFKKILDSNEINLNYQILLFFNEAFQNEYVSKIIPFQYWYSVSLSIYDVLDSIKVRSDKDTEEFESTMSLLQSLSEKYRLPGPKDRLVDFFIKNYGLLSDSNIVMVLDYYSEERLCIPFNPHWKENCLKILYCFYYDDSRGSGIKIKVLELMKQAFDLSYPVFGIELAEEIMFDIFKRSSTLIDEDVILLLLKYFIDISLKSPISFFKKISDVLVIGFKQTKTVERRKSLVSLNSSNSTKTQEPTFTTFILGKITETFAKLFVITSATDGEKAKELYDILIHIAGFSITSSNHDLLMVISKCLVRLRATSEGFVYFVKPRDMEGLASTLGRNLITEDDTQLARGPSWQWSYPENPDYLPEEFFYMPSSKLRYLDSNDSKFFTVDDNVIDISKWLDICLFIMQDFINWELYSFIWAHFCPQLANSQLFENNNTQIIKLRTIITDQLTMKFPSLLSLPLTVTKPDLQVAFIRTLSALFAYHDIFAKIDEDQIVSALLSGLTSWEKTAIPCIHCLTVCCYEFPLSIKKFLSLILTNLQTRISSSFATAHILEFLLSLVHLPRLTSNFTLDEFKRVFGIAFKYIQYSYDTNGSKSKQRPKSSIQEHGVDALVEVKPSTETMEITPVMSEYLLALSFSVISSWFLKMKIKERKLLSSYLVKNLILSTKIIQRDGKGSTISDQGIVFLDLISRFTYSDLDLRSNSIVVPKVSGKTNISSNKWIIGISIVSIDTDAETGESTISIRRPTGTSLLRVSPDSSMLPKWFSDGRRETKGVFDIGAPSSIFTPSYMLLQLVNHMEFSNNAKAKPIPLPEDVATSRAISSFDRIPIVEFHKIGVIYIGPKQKNEIDILSNSYGSSQYQDFLDNLGTLIKLKGCKHFYVGGLDTDNNLDGEYSIFWDDKITQLIYHVTTMMPNNDNDKYLSMKKRHIGNNYVNIFFDESGLPFDFNVIKSQFNFLNIVISSHTESVAMYNSREPQIRQNSSTSLPNQRKRFFKVKTYRKAGVPGVFATSHFKIISEEKLSSFVRNLALVANQFASVWHSHDEYVSNWSHRMRQINTLKERAVQYHENLRQEQKIAKAAKIGQSFMDQLQAIDLGTSDMEGHPQRYEYVDEEEDNDLYKIFEFNSYTC